MADHLQAHPSEYDHLLGPVLKHASGTPAARVLAVLVRGLNAEVPSDDIRLWIRSRSSSGSIRHAPSAASSRQAGARAHSGSYDAGHQRGMADRIRALVDSSEWEQLVASARSKASSSSDASGARIARSRRIAARKLLAGLLQPLPGDRALLARNVKARVAFAEIGLRIVDDEHGWDTAIMSNAALAAIMGWNQQAAEKATAELRQRHMVKAQRSGPYLPSRYRLSATLLSNRAFVSELEPSAIALVDGCPDEVALLVRSVRHPAWNYSTVLSHRHWLLLLADALQGDPADFGIRAVIARQLRRELEEAFGLNPDAVNPTLIAVLDYIADQTRFGKADQGDDKPVTPRRAQELSLERYRSLAATNKAAAERATEKKQDTYEVLTDLLGRHPIPPSPFGGKLASQSKRQKRFREWVDGLHQEILVGGPSEEFRRRVGAALEQKLIGRGYPMERRLDGLAEPVQFAASTARFIMEADAGSSLDEWLIRSATRDVAGSSAPDGRGATGGGR